MATLYIRDVGDDVATALKQNAAAKGVSLSAYVGAELAKLTHRGANAQLVARLKTRDRQGGALTADILAVLEAERRAAR